MNLLFIQAQEVASEALKAVATGEQELSLGFWEMAIKGGWIMIPLAFLSIIAIYIFFERFFAIREANKIDNNFMNMIRDYIKEGRIDAAQVLCKNTNSPVSLMISKGISRIGRPLNDVHAAIENVGNMEVSKLEKGLNILASVAGGAPMIGFLGTVIGMIKAFYDMSMAGNNIDISNLSGGIYTAMVTTVAGLIVGIVAYFAYNILVSKVSKVVFKMESHTTDFMDLLNEPAK
jgi:biopolymer transport protein ExbB